jgi:hypothetical protein
MSSIFTPMVTEPPLSMPHSVLHSAKNLHILPPKNGMIAVDPENVG